MRLLRHWKMILGLMAIFGTGVGTGGVGTIFLLYKTFTRPVITQRWVDDRMAELDLKLTLTPEQEGKIRPIVQSAAERFQTIGTETFDEIRATAEQAHADVAKELTPEQQVEFKKLRPKVLNALRDLSQRAINVRSSSNRGTTQTAPDAAPPAESPQ